MGASKIVSYVTNYAWAVLIQNLKKSGKCVAMKTYRSFERSRNKIQFSGRLFISGEVGAWLKRTFLFSGFLPGLRLDIPQDPPAPTKYSQHHFI